MKLFHVSDLHVRGRMEDNKDLADNLKQLREAFSKQDDLLVITGDITDDGKEGQYKNAKALLEWFAGKIIMVPGNHDYGPLGNFYDKLCVSRYQKLEAELGYRDDYIRMASYRMAAIIKLDTNLKTKNVLDFAQGKVGMMALWGLRRKLEWCHKHNLKSLVMLHHTPFAQEWFLRLEDAKELLRDTLFRATAVLCGHEHKERLWRCPAHAPLTTYWSADSFQYKGKKPNVILVDDRGFAVLSEKSLTPTGGEVK